MTNESSPACRVGGARVCGWTHHNFKHFARRGAIREWTLDGNPALYLPLFAQVQIQQIERLTTCRPDLHDGALPGRIRYAREAESIIGWDTGRDAAWSYAECSGGAAAGRFIHGRPMHEGNAALAALRHGGLR